MDFDLKDAIWLHQTRVNVWISRSHRFGAKWKSFSVSSAFQLFSCALCWRAKGVKWPLAPPTSFSLLCSKGKKFEKRKESSCKVADFWFLPHVLIVRIGFQGTPQLCVCGVWCYFEWVVEKLAFCPLQPFADCSFARHWSGCWDLLINDHDDDLHPLNCSSHHLCVSHITMTTLNWNWLRLISFHQAGLLSSSFVTLLTSNNKCPTVSRPGRWFYFITTIRIRTRQESSTKMARNASSVYILDSDLAEDQHLQSLLKVPSLQSNPVYLYLHDLFLFSVDLEIGYSRHFLPARQQWRGNFHERLRPTLWEAALRCAWLWVWNRSQNARLVKTVDGTSSTHWLPGSWWNTATLALHRW